MSQGGEKTEKATPKKRRDAREKGQVLKSNEINTAFSLIAIFGAFKGLSNYMGGRFVYMIEKYISPAFIYGFGDMHKESPKLLMQLVIDLMMVALPIMAVAMLVGLILNYAQVGVLFSPKALAPKFSRINPMQGFKRIFSSRSIVELVKSVLKVVILGKIVYDEYAKNIAIIPSFMHIPISRGIGAIVDTVLNAGLKAGLALVFIAAGDFLYQWWSHEKELRMSKQEIKDEYKMMEGDPQIKSKVRQKQREMGMMRMMQDVPEADVVITNPTHYAVALKYDENAMAAPTVIAKGQGFIAQRIREVAGESAIQIIENKPVARSLFFFCEVGDAIPEDLYQAVAEILAVVYRAKTAQAGGRA